MLGEHLAQRDPLLGVQAGGRLVEHEQLRVPEQGLGQPDPPALTAGQGPDPRVARSVEVDVGEDPSYLLDAALGLVPLLEHGHVVDEPVGSEAARVAELLRQVAQPPANLGALRRRGRVAAQDPHLALVGTEHGGERCAAGSSCRRRWVRAGQARPAGRRGRCRAGRWCHGRIGQRRWSGRWVRHGFSGRWCWWVGAGVRGVARTGWRRPGGSRRGPQPEHKGVGEHRQRGRRRRADRPRGPPRRRPRPRLTAMAVAAYSALTQVPTARTATVKPRRAATKPRRLTGGRQQQPGETRDAGSAVTARRSNAAGPAGTSVGRGQDDLVRRVRPGP